MNILPLPDTNVLTERLSELHSQLRERVYGALQNAAIEALSQTTEVRGGDAIFALDVHADEVLLPFCERWGRETPFLLVAEGLPDGRQLWGCNDLAQAQCILICDPIDGTRPLMYDKRSAWLLTGIAPNKGGETNLSDITVAMMTELPTTKGRYSDTISAVQGQGAHAIRHDMATGADMAFAPRPSQATTIEGGYAMFSKFFPGSKGWLAELEERLLQEVLGAPQAGIPQTFDDQYISSGGQFYELLSGRDRFNADLRPLAHAKLHGGSASRLCCHPYDLCTELIARELGVIITDETGGPLRVPLDVDSPVSWIGYANEFIRHQIEPPLLRLLNSA